MSFIAAAAVVGGAVIGGVASNMAAGKQAKGQRQAARTQQRIFNTINQQEQPFIQSGYGAQNALNDLLGTGVPSSAFDKPIPQAQSRIGASLGDKLHGMNPSGGASADMPPPGSNFGETSGLGTGYLTHQFNTQDFYNNLDPGYQFQLQQGQQAIRNASTPGVGALSGPALKELMSFNQGLAGTSYQNAFNRFTTQQNNIFGRLSQIAGLGQNAATQVGNQGTQLGTGIAQAQAAAGTSQAAGIVGAGNSIGSGIQLAGLLKGGYLGGDQTTQQTKPTS